MRLKFIGCKVLTREISYIVSQSENFIDMTWIKQGYHCEPDKLRKILQDCIDRIDDNIDPYTCDTIVDEFDAILLGYGLCSNGISGLTSKKYKIIVPKAHDCITLFLGSKDRYKEIFDSKSGGIFWYTAGWIENSLMPSRHSDARAFEEYKKEYGEDNAEYLVEMNKGWMSEYKAAAYVEIEGFNLPSTKDFTKDCANYLNWEYLEYIGDPTLLNDFLNGKWDKKRFLTVPPNKKITPSFNEDVITC